MHRGAVWIKRSADPGGRRSPLGPSSTPRYTPPMPAFLLLSAALAAPPEAPPVRTWTGDLPRTAPHGKARVWPLAEGSNAWVGRLELEAGAKVPAHRDPTEETIVVLSGGGVLTLDGVQHELGVGSAVLMPAGAEVSFDNGPERLVAIQVFAGPEPAGKYAAWASGEAAQPLRVAHEGPLSVACSGSECVLLHGGTAVGEAFWSYAPPAEVLQPLAGPIPMLGDAWLLRSEEGDGCPSRYEAVCLVDGKAVRSPTFGNCNDPEAVLRDGDGIRLRFPGSGSPGDVGHRVAGTVRVDPRTCATRP